MSRVPVTKLGKKVFDTRENRHTSCRYSKAWMVTYMDAASQFWISRACPYQRLEMGSRWNVVRLNLASD